MTIIEYAVAEDAQKALYEYRFSSLTKAKRQADFLNKQVRRLKFFVYQITTTSKIRRIE